MQANMGVSVSILDSTDPAPASVAAKQMVGSFTDAEAIKNFVKNEVIDVLTVEIEHINVDALEEVQNELGTDIQPTPATLRIIQDKYAQKEFFDANDIAVVDFMDVPDQVCTDELQPIRCMLALYDNMFTRHNDAGPNCMVKESDNTQRYL
jgi:phosphoribosylaminoimidazole carboxylase (NCAIR synthetase)